jgi:hypothetical protein
MNLVVLSGVFEHDDREGSAVDVASAAFGSIGGPGDDRGVELAVDVDDEIVNRSVEECFEGFVTRYLRRRYVGGPTVGSSSAQLP